MYLKNAPCFTSSAPVNHHTETKQRAKLHGTSEIPWGSRSRPRRTPQQNLQRSRSPLFVHQDVRPNSQHLLCGGGPNRMVVIETVPFSSPGANEGGVMAVGPGHRHCTAGRDLVVHDPDKIVQNAPCTWRVYGRDRQDLGSSMTYRVVSTGRGISCRIQETIGTTHGNWKQKRVCSTTYNTFEVDA